MTPKKILIGSGKGGSCKTTLCVNLAIACHEIGYRTLVIDMDSQGDTTALFGLSDVPSESTVLPLMDGKAAVPVIAHGVGIVATHEDYALRSQLLHDTRNKIAFRSGIKETCELFKPDLIFFDVPPIESVPGGTALAMSDYVIISLLPHERSFTGAKTLAELVNAFNEGDGKNIQLLGVVPVGEAPTSACYKISKQSERYFGEKMTKGIPWRTAFQEASSANMPIAAYELVRLSKAKPYQIKGKDWHILTRRFREIAQELIDRRIYNKEPVAFPEKTLTLPLPINEDVEGDLP